MAPLISVQEVMKHATSNDCWIVVNGKVYDLTSFAPNHPGGEQTIHVWAGTDASEIYNAYHAGDLIDRELAESDKKGDVDSATITEAWTKAQQRTTIKSSSQERPPLSAILNLHNFEQSFAQFGPPRANAYVASASNDLLTHTANAEYWQKLWFRPRILRNVAHVNTRISLLGCNVAMPVWICPMGIAMTAGPEGESALGRGAAASGIIHCASTTSSLAIDDILASAPSNPWFFQLYVDRQREKTEALLSRINHMDQIKAVFVTVDLPVVSKREADQRLKPQSPEGTVTKGGGLAQSAGGFIDPALSWEDIGWIRRHCDRPILLKGIQTVQDAKRAYEVGCQGIVISNHGGRALDSAPATVAVLLEIRRDCPELFEQMEILVDGGIRRGSDILKAFCLGARGVGVGRPFQCSVAYGTEGVRHCAAILQDELETSMRLCGITDLNSVHGDLSFLNTSELDNLLPPQKERYRELRCRPARSSKL